MLIVTVIVDELKWIWILMDNLDNTESPDFELLDSETLSNFSGFSPSDICDMDNIDNISYNSDADIDVSFSSSDDSDNEENVDEYGNYWDDLIDEQICAHSDRNPPNWSANKYKNFNVPDYTGPPDVATLPPDFNVDSSNAVDYFSLYFTQELLDQIVLHTNNYACFCILMKRQLWPNYFDKQWSLDGSNNLTIQELKAYFEIIIILGINPVKQYRMAFSADPFLGNEGI